MISILGTDYEIIECDETQMQDKDNEGECDRYAKIIRINSDAFVGENLTRNIKGAIDKTIRHELFHAILHEAGLDCYAEDETLVDALAILYPKINKIMEVTAGEKNSKNNSI